MLFPMGEKTQKFLSRIGIILFVQFAFWFLVAVFILNRPEIKSFLLTDITVIPFAEDRITPMEEKAFPFREGYNSGAKTAIYRIKVPKEKIIQENAALLLPQIRDQATISINGTVIAYPPYSDNGKITISGHHPHLYALPDLSDTTSSLQIDIKADRLDLSTYSLGFFYGPFDNLYSVQKFLILSLIYLPYSLAIAAILVAVFLIALSPMVQSKALIISQIIVLLIFFMRAGYYLLTDMTLSSKALYYYGFLASTALLIASAAMVNEWTQPRGNFRKVFFGCLIITWATLTVLYVAVPYWYYKHMLTAAILEGLVAIPMVGFMLWRLIRSALTGSITDSWVSAILLLGVTSTLGQFLITYSSKAFSVWQYSFSTLSQLAALFISFAIALFMAQRGNILYRTANTAVGLLNVQIESKEQEIEDAYVNIRLKEEQQTLLDERERIMRDMHDGIGGKLSILLAKIRSQTTTNHEVELVLEEGLQDLRLMINALDSSGNTLDEALDKFQTEMMPILTAANISSKWVLDTPLHFIAVNPQNILSLFRVLQEATLNVIRHSQARDYHFQAKNNPDAGTMEITIHDNGIGFSDSRKGGHGINNMRHRIEQLGGTFSIIGNETGTHIYISLPS